MDAVQRAIASPATAPTVTVQRPENDVSAHSTGPKASTAPKAASMTKALNLSHVGLNVTAVGTKVAVSRALQRRPSQPGWTKTFETVVSALRTAARTIKEDIYVIRAMTDSVIPKLLMARVCPPVTPLHPVSSVFLLSLSVR